MADKIADNEIGDWLISYGNVTRASAETPTDESAGWLDWPKEFGAQAAGIVAAPLGAAQVATATAYPNLSEVFGGLSQAAHGAETGLRESETPVSRRAAEATIFPEEGKQSFFKTPIRSAFMQSAGLAAFGGALAASAAIAPEGFLAGLATDAAAGGIFGAAQVADRAAQHYNNPELTDKKLAEEDPRFKMLVEQGIDPKEARNMRMQEVVNDAPLYANGLAGALGMGIGGRVLRGTTGGTGGAFSRAGLGAGENALGMGAMGAGGTYAEQDLEIAQGKRTDYDYRKMWLAAANSAAIGGAVGTVGGVLHRPDGRRVREDATPTVENVGNSQLDATNTVALTPPPPVDASAELSKFAAPTSRPLEPSRDKSQGVTAEEVAALKGELPPPEAAAPVAAPEVPIIHPGEPEKPIATVAHPDVPEVTPPAPHTVEPVAPTTATPERAPTPVTEARIDPATGRRVLEGPRWGEKEGWQTPPGATEVPRAAPTEEPGKTVWTKREAEQRDKNHEIATRVLGNESPLEPFTENTVANREMLRSRLQGQVSEALASGFGVIKRDKGGTFENRIPDRVSKMSGETMWLADAQRMLRKLNNKTIPPLREINKFIADENAGRRGEWSVMAERRKIEGASFGEGRKKQAAAEAVPEEVSGGDAMDRLKSAEPTPEDIILQHEEDMRKQLEERAANEPVAPVEPQPRERAAPKIEGPAYTAVKERTAPVVTTRGRGRYEGMRPKVAEKVALSRKLKEKVEQEAKKPLPPELMAHLSDEEIRSAKDEIRNTGKATSQQAKEFLEWQKRKRDQRTRIPGTDYSPEYAKGPPKPFGNFIREYVAQHGYNRVTIPGLNRIVTSQFQRAIARLAADTPVYIIDPEVMGRSRIGSRALAYHDSVHNFIAIRSDLFAEHKDPAATYQTILHEGVHAALDHLAENNVHARDLIKRMSDHVRDELDIREKLTGYLKDRDTAYAFRTYEGYIHQDREFMTQAISSERFQKVLSEIEAPADLVKQLGMNERRPMSMWELFVHAVRKWLGMPKEQHTMLEAVMRATEQLGDLASREHGTSPGDVVTSKQYPYEKEILMAHEDTTESTFRNVLARGAENAHQELGKFAADPVNRTTELARDIVNQPDIMKGLRAFSNIFLANHMHLQRIKHLDKDIVGTVYNAIERQGTYARKLRDAVTPFIADWIRIEKKVPGQYSDAVDIIHEATRYGVDPTSALGAGRNERLAVNKQVQAKLDKGAKIGDLIDDVNADHINAILAHPELTRRYQELIKKEPKFERLIKDTFNHYDEVQLAESKNIIRGALEATGKFPERADLNKRVDQLSDMVITKENTEALKQEIGEAALDHVLKGKSLVGNGPYAPLIRRGEWVVRGKYKINAPSNAIQKVGPNAFEFATKKEAVDFAQSTGLHAKYDTAYYDPTTGEKTTKLGGVSVAGGPEQRWVATLQHEHMNQHESLKVAQKQYEDLQKTGLFDELHAPVAQREYHNLSGELTHGAVGSLIRQLEKTDAYRRADSTTQAEMRNSIVAAGNIARAGNRVQSRSLPRRNVPGFSSDFTRNLEEYSTASSYYRAKQVYRPQIDDMIMQLEHSVRNIADKHETDRSVELKEVINRARAPNPEQYTGKFAEIARRIGIWSYIDRMMRVSHLILHQTHLPMITAPIIAGRHGVARTYATIAGAWRDAFPAMKAGGIDFKNSLYDPLIQGVNYSEFIGGLYKGAKDHSHIVDMIQKLNEDGTIHPQAGIEVHKYTPSRQLGGPLGAVDRTMSYLDTTFRHLTNATEAINRHVGAVAAYRLEFQKLRRQGLTDAAAHDRAVAYASDILKNTQGLYSSTNAAPLFKVPYLRPFLQFKQFPQMMYHLMTRSLLNGFKKMPEGLDAAGQKEFRMQRADALRGLAYLLTTHTLATGLLGGLPTEPLKYTGAVTKALGITNDDFTAVDRWLYDKAVANFGKEGAEWIMHGLARGLGPDVHHRMGMSSLTSWGLDKVTSAADFKGFLFDQAIGAPGSLATDTFTGLRQMADANNMSEVTAGALKAFPLQAMRDIQKAWSGKGSGKYEYSPYERGIRALGFTPVGEAEEAERKAETYREVDKYNQERRSLMRKWEDADPSDKASAWSRIQKFNRDKPRDSQITMKQLTDAAKRRKKGEDEGDIVHGVRLNKQTRFIGERANAIY